MGFLLVEEVYRAIDRAYLVERESRPEADTDSKYFLAMRAVRHASGYNRAAS
jgi:hypothetical protein